MPAAWEEKSPRTEKVVMAASFRSGGPRRGVSGGGRSCLASSLPSPLLIPTRVCLGIH